MMSREVNRSCHRIFLFCCAMTLGCGGATGECSPVANQESAAAETDSSVSMSDAATVPVANSDAERSDEKTEVTSTESADGPQEIGPPPELIKENMETTAFSGVVILDSVKIVGPNGGPLDGSGYADHLYQATVVETMVGSALPTISFAQMADEDIEPMELKRKLFVSLCKREGEDVVYYFTPDVGYVFDVSEAQISKIRALGVPKTPSKSPAACAD